MARIYSIEEKREDDAGQAWLEYSKAWNLIAVSSSMYQIAKQAFIAGYLEGRKDGKIGV